MKQGLSEIVLVLDMTGSMTSIADETVIGCNRFIEEHKNFPGEANFTLVLFNSVEYRQLYNGMPIANVGEINRNLYVPNGMTPLHGAIGRCIDETGKRLAAMDEADRPEKVIFVIMTDGEENWSHQLPWSKAYDLKRVHDMIVHQKEAYKWEFIFLGANIDAFHEGGNLGIDAKDIQQFQATDAGIRSAYAVSASSSLSYRPSSSPDWKSNLTH